MPFKSKAQQRWMFAAEARGEVPKGTAERWAKHTSNIKSLPAKKGKNKGGYVDDFVGKRLNYGGTYNMGGESYKYGGIHINPSNKGKFTATKKFTGKSTEELTHSKNPLTKKRAIFAENAKHWNHKNEGGYYMNDGGAVTNKDYYETDITTTKIKAHVPPKKAYGGYIEGTGDGMSDSIPAKVKKGSFIVPADHALLAEQLRSQYFGNNKKANLNQKDGQRVNLSNGEHIFSPMETKILSKKVDMNSLAPKSKKKFNFNKF